jgi:Ca2+-binding RTX toxin-like protein
MALIKGTNKLGQTINGTGGDDHIVALGGNDIIFGGAGNDRINAGAGDDNVTGGTGDDLLHGNGGADTFHYSFTIEGGSGTTSTFGGFNDEGDGKLSTTEFVHQYDTWLRTLGSDLNDDGVITVANDGGSATELSTVEGYDGTFSAKIAIGVYAGPNLQSRYYSASATSAGAETVTSADGHDTIVDFHVGLDSMDLGTLTEAQFLAHFAMDDSADVNGDLVNDTVITITGDTTFSITLLGVNGYSLSDFYG